MYGSTPPPPGLETFRFEDEDDYETTINLNLFLRFLKK